MSMLEKDKKQWAVENTAHCFLLWQFEMLETITREGPRILSTTRFPFPHPIPQVVA